MDNQELKPCILCKREFHITNWSEHDRTFYVACKCGLMMEHIDKEKLIKAWNRRIND